MYHYLYPMIFQMNAIKSLESVGIFNNIHFKFLTFVTHICCTMYIAFREEEGGYPAPPLPLYSRFLFMDLESNPPPSFTDIPQKKILVNG